MASNASVRKEEEEGKKNGGRRQTERTDCVAGDKEEGGREGCEMLTLNWRRDDKERNWSREDEEADGECDTATMIIKGFRRLYRTDCGYDSVTLGANNTCLYAI